MEKFLNELANVVPSKRQLAWFDIGFYAFVHFTVNTYTNLEWGKGDEPEEIFNPVKLDCDQWVQAVKSAGMKGMILTAKHHDGFCLWPSKYTEHSVKNSPYKGDVVKEAADACRRGGIKFGFYLSPWDLNSKLYGTDEYNDYFCNQLTELLTGYGDIFCVWFDNACGEGPNGKRQKYDFPRYIELIRKYQPNAVIFNDHGPDIRWCGNEAGSARLSEWAVVPGELCKYSEVQSGPGPMAEKGDLSYLNSMEKNIGTLDVVMFSKGLTFTPAEIDTSIRKGWFYHPEEEPRTVDDLFSVYLQAVGGNCCLNLNIPPNQDGLFDEKDVKRLAELGERIRKFLGTEIPSVIKKREKGDIYQDEYEIIFEGPVDNIRYVVVEEDLTYGQRIEGFQIIHDVDGYRDFAVFSGTTVGNRKICKLVDGTQGQNPMLFGEGRPPVEALVLKITSARGKVHLKNIKVY